MTTPTDPGDCGRCAHARTQPSARPDPGGARVVYWRCGLADRNRAFRRYPPLPVRGCRGLELSVRARRTPDSGSEPESGSPSDDGPLR